MCNRLDHVARVETRVLSVPLAAVVLLLLAGCGAAAPAGSTSLSAMPSPASSAASFTVPTALFQSSQLGISFRYPTSWHIRSSQYRSSFAGNGIASVCFSSERGAEQQGSLTLLISSARVFQRKPPGPFMDALPSEASGFREAKVKLTHIGFMRLDGLRFVTAIANGSAIAPIGSKGAWQERVLLSRSDAGPPFPTFVQIEIGTLRSEWRAEQPLLDGVLASMRFSTPTGGWPGS